MELDDILTEEWDAVRKRFYYPQLPRPELVDNINGMIDFTSLQITIGRRLLEILNDGGVDDRAALNEVLTHELTHYMKFPGSVLDMLRLHKVALDVLGGRSILRPARIVRGLFDSASKASMLRTAFVEAQTNIYQVVALDCPNTVKARRAAMPNDPFTKLMYALYQEKWGEDVGVRLDDKDMAYLEKLKPIQYTDKDNELNNFRTFVDILKDYKVDSDQKKNSSGLKGLLNAAAKKLRSLLGREDTDMPVVGIKMFSDNEIAEGVRAFAAECDGDEFVKVLQSIKEETELIQGAGTERRDAILSEGIYSALARMHTVPIREKDFEKTSGLYPYSHTDFSVGDSISDLDPYSAPGLLPGITKRWVRKGTEGMGELGSIPDSLIIVDNSGSMPSPKYGLSIPILAATVISDAYLDAGSYVSVYSFGGKDIVLPFTRDRDEAHKNIILHTGGGTVFDSGIIGALLRERDDPFDVSVVSDMDIANIGSFVDTISAIPKIHRIHLIYTSSSTKYKIEQFEGVENIALIKLYGTSDIDDIVMGELPKSL